MANKSNKISIRITPWQGQVLQEMCETLGTSYSLLIRTIIGNWLTVNEDYIYRLIDKKKEEKYGIKMETGTTLDLFGE